MYTYAGKNNANGLKCNSELLAAAGTSTFFVQDGFYISKDLKRGHKRVRHDLPSHHQASPLKEEEEEEEDTTGVDKGFFLDLSRLISPSPTRLDHEDHIALLCLS